jgi:hypothetical protein
VCARASSRAAINCTAKTPSQGSAAHSRRTFGQHSACLRTGSEGLRCLGRLAAVLPGSARVVHSGSSWRLGTRNHQTANPGRVSSPRTRRHAESRHQRINSSRHAGGTQDLRPAEPCSGAAPSRRSSAHPTYGTGCKRRSRPRPAAPRLRRRSQAQRTSRIEADGRSFRPRRRSDLRAKQQDGPERGRSAPGHSPQPRGHVRSTSASRMDGPST